MSKQSQGGQVRSPKSQDSNQSSFQEAPAPLSSDHDARFPGKETEALGQLPAEAADPSGGAGTGAASRLPRCTGRRVGGVQAQGRRAAWNLSRGRRDEAGKRAPSRPPAFRKRCAPGRRRRAIAIPHPGGECGLGPRGRGGAAQRGPLALLGTSQRLQRFSGSAGGAGTRWVPLGWAPLSLGFSFITCEMGASVGPVVAGPGKGGPGARDPS